MLEKANFESDEQKEEWRQTLKLELISSDESGIDNEESEEVIIKSHFHGALPNWMNFFVDWMMKVAKKSHHRHVDK